jgi:hypothetical protein
MRALVPCLVLMTLVGAGCALVKEKSRVAVPGSNLTVVLGEDEKRMYRYWVLADGRRVSDEVFLGPHDTDSSVKAVIARQGNVVTLTWRGSLSAQFVEIDVANCRVVGHSNDDVPLPDIRGCVSTHVT